MASSQNELSEKEKELFRYTQEQNYDEVKRLITEEENIYVDCIDADGMTPLQHAAYKGCYKLCKLLLDCGADVNLTKHVSRYNALTFAGLSGKADVVRLLLEHGASTTAVNSINKTAAQMSAFVGNHHIVSIINNFIPIQRIEYFNVKRGIYSQPDLEPAMNSFVHKMAIMTNIHPVRLAIHAQNNSILLENSSQAVGVLQRLAEQYFEDEGNELLSLKFHHLGHVLHECASYYKQHKPTIETGEKPVKECLNPWIKHMIKGDINGFPVNLEKYLRRDIREYPYVDCNLFQQLVRTISPVKIGDEPSALSIITEAVNGQRGGDSNSNCATCGDPNAEKKCSACKSVQYCDKACQKLHWFTHKTICAHFSKLNEDIEKLKIESNSDEKNPDADPDEAGCSNQS